MGVEVGEGRAHSLMYTAGWVERHGGGARGRAPQHAVHSKHPCFWPMLLVLDRSSAAAIAATENKAHVIHCKACDLHQQCQVHLYVLGRNSCCQQSWMPPC